MAQNKFCFLIDDDDDDREVFLSAVADVNATTTCEVVNDPEQALKFLKATDRLPDLIFVDINMPKMDGFEFIVHLKRDQRLSRIPVIFYSTTRDELQISRASQLGASAFVSKTSDYHSLCEILRHFLRDENQIHSFKFSGQVS